MLALPPLPVRAAVCSQPWWFMRHRFGGAGELSNFRPGECVSISAGHELGGGWGG